MNIKRLVGRRKFLVIPLLGIAAAASGVVALQTSSSANANCDPLVGTIKESPQYTPYDEQRGGLPDVPLNPTGSDTPPVPQDVSVPSINGVPRQWALLDGDGAVYQYYLDKPIGREMTRAAFQESGGIELEANPANDKQSFAAYLQEQFGDRVVPVGVGDADGGVVWADPESTDGLRLHHVYWDHRGHTFGLIVDQPAEDAVTSARQVACSLP